MSDDSEWVSKSQKKRDAESVLDLVKELILIKADDLARFPMPESVLQGLLDAKRMTQHGARKRHLKWLAKQLRSEDIDQIEAAYQQLMLLRQGETAEFHLSEQWRTRLIEQDNQALTDFIRQYEPEDVQALRQLVRKAKKEQAQDRDLGAKKALFRLIKAIIS